MIKTTSRIDKKQVRTYAPELIEKIDNMLNGLNKAEMDTLLMRIFFDHSLHMLQKMGFVYEQSNDKKLFVTSFAFAASSTAAQLASEFAYNFNDRYPHNSDLVCELREIAELEGELCGALLSASDIDFELLNNICRDNRDKDGNK